MELPVFKGEEHGTGLGRGIGALIDEHAIGAQAVAVALSGIDDLGLHAVLHGVHSVDLRRAHGAEQQLHAAVAVQIFQAVAHLGHIAHNAHQVVEAFFRILLRSEALKQSIKIGIQDLAVEGLGQHSGLLGGLHRFGGFGCLCRFRRGLGGRRGRLGLAATGS